MNKHTLRVLEFEKVRALVRERCLTVEANQVLRRERVSTDHQEISAKLDRVSLARRLLTTTVTFPSIAFPDTRNLLNKLGVEGSVGDPESFGELLASLAGAAALCDYLTAAAEETGVDLTDPFVVELATHGIQREIGRIVDPDGTIREREIPELKRLRNEIANAQRSLQKQSASLAISDAVRRLLSNSVPTQRDGRIVLAVKADHRGKVKGIVHELSGSGSTIYVEPESLVELNNTVVESEHRYRNAVLRILRELSDKCREQLPAIEAATAWVRDVDLVLARARFGRDFACARAELTDDRLSLKGARHPLLGGDAVPIRVDIPEGKRVLIVTGPNTGGKTVSLKTVGLFSLMNQFGLEVPASTGSELPVFTGIYADIGDEQSIEQNLSTFSGHMRNISRILNHADANSLVLLDELGSGTDPEEGGALAMAILDELLERSCFTLITTHHGRLKHYGFSHDRATNASMEFDTQNLRPTYHIVPGVPGSSHAVEIASQMGVLRSVTRQAKEYLEGEEYDTGRIIRRLTDREQELRRETKALDAREDELKRLGEAIKNDQLQLQAREAELRRGQLRELDEWARGARSQLENLVRQIREGELTREKTQQVKQFIAEIDQGLERQRTQATPTKPAGQGSSAVTPDARRSLVPGSRVRVVSSGQVGTVDRPGKGSTWVVQLGGVRIPLEASDLEALPEESSPEQAQVTYLGGSGRPLLELDLRGRRLDEALAEVDRQLDQALVSGMGQFGIIHGMGEGVLQRGIRDALRQNPHVKSIEFALPEDGGYGKTIVLLG